MTIYRFGVRQVANFRLFAHQTLRRRPRAKIIIGTKPIVALHLPKAGGNSLRDQFEKVLGRDLLLDYAHDPLTYSSRKPHRFPKNKQMVIGHFHASRYKTTAGFHFTFLREPVSNIISIYYFWRGLRDHGHPVHSRFLTERPSILEFAQYSGIRNLMSELYFGDIDMKLFDFIGFHETRQVDFARLSVILDVNLSSDVHLNRTPYCEERVEVSNKPLLIEKLRDILAQDVEFYWRMRRERT